MSFGIDSVLVLVSGCGLLCTHLWDPVPRFRRHPFSDYGFASVCPDSFQVCVCVCVCVFSVAILAQAPHAWGAWLEGQPRGAHAQCLSASPAVFGML